MKSSPKSLNLIYAVFFLSGMAGLIYEISWSRQIGLLFGHTVQAASTVLASYFAGMGLGYWLGGKLSRRVSPLLGYAVAEFVIAAWAIAIPFLIQLSESSQFSPMLSSDSWAWQTFLRGVFSFALLLPATISMGVTLPMMADFLTESPKSFQQSHRNSARVTWAYALNTFGALAGTLLATFVLLINVGVCGSSYIAVMLSILCGVLTLIVLRNDPSYTEPLSDSVSSPSAFSTMPVVLAFVSGFGTLALQVLFTRMFALVFHNSTYTFGIVVAVFLAALACGAASASWLQRWMPARKLAGLTVGIGSVLTLAAIIIFVQRTELRYFSAGDSFAGYIYGACGLVLISIGPAIFCLGMLLPLVWAIASEPAEVSEANANANHNNTSFNRSAGNIVGSLTSVNTWGAAIGAITASFFLLVFVGLWKSIVLIGVLFLLCGIWLMLASKQRLAAITISIIFVFCTIAAVQSPNDAKYGREQLGEEIIKRFDSPYGWIDVVKLEESSAYKIRQNLHYRFGRTGNNVREFRQAHIPLLLHPKPRSVLFLGLGTGLTAGGAIPHEDLKSIEAVELIPEVVDAVRMLAEFNYNIVDHPKSTIHVDDARHFLLANPKRYDVIVSDLFVPWESESGYLYTVEHYEVALDRLKEDGLFCQWLPMYQIGDVEFESIANSFSKVFPHTTIWWGQLSNRKPVLALVGSRRKITIDSQLLSQRIESVNRNRNVVDPQLETVPKFWEHYAGDWKPTSEKGLNTDEFPRVEFLTPVSNRNRELLSGANFESFYEEFMRSLPTGGATISSGSDIPTMDQIRARQRLILFGSSD